MRRRGAGRCHRHGELLLWDLRPGIGQEDVPHERTKDAGADRARVGLRNGLCVGRMGSKDGGLV